MEPACHVSVGRAQKRNMASARLSVWEKAVPCSPLDTRHFSYFLYATGAFQDASLVLELRGSESEQVSPCVGSLRGTTWDCRSFLHRLNVHQFLQPEVMGTYLPGTGTLGGGSSVGLGLLAQIQPSQILFLNVEPQKINGLLYLKKFHN